MTPKPLREFSENLLIPFSQTTPTFPDTKHSSKPTSHVDRTVFCRVYGRESLVFRFRVWVLGVVLGFSVASLMSGGVAGATPYSDVVLADNPVSYWRLDNGAPGAIYGDPDTARSYDASGALTIAYSAERNTPQFTVEAWSRVDAQCECGGDYRTILASRGGSGHFSGYQMGFLSYGQARLGFQVGDALTWQALQSDPVILGEWHHIVGSFDGLVQRLFVNGELVGSQETGYAESHGSPFGIATQYPLVNGFVDEVAYYNYPLSADRVAAHYQTGIGIVPEPTTALLVGLGLIGLGVRRRVS